MMQSIRRSTLSQRAPMLRVSFLVRLSSMVLLPILAPVGLLFAGLIWLEDGGPIVTSTQLDGFEVPSFRIATVDLDKWDLRIIPPSLGQPERLIVVPTLTVIGNILTVLRLDRLPALLSVVSGRVSPAAVLRVSTTVLM